MAEPSNREFGAPARRPVGRLGLVLLLSLGVVALAAMTWAEGVDRAGSTTTAADAPARDDPGDPDDPAAAGAAHVAFGSVTAHGAVLFRLTDPVHASVVDESGRLRWERDLARGERLVCDPCPAAVLVSGDGRAVGIAADGSPAPAPPGLDGGVLDVTSLSGVVLAAARPGGRVAFVVPTSDGLIGAGELADDRVTELAAVTPSTDGGSVTVMRPVADPLHQGEFELVHVTPAGSWRAVVALDGPDAHPLPCAAAEAATVADVQLARGPTADGVTHVSRRDGPDAVVDAVLDGAFGSCAASTSGVVLAAVSSGADGNLDRSRVDLRWLGAELLERGRASEAVEATLPSVAIDASSGRVVVAGGPGPSVRLDGTSRELGPPAEAVAFDDRGGLWSVDGTGGVTHELRP